jgi:dolichyl-phosphate-mannose--protein O-mannosyl transferase
MAVEGKLCPHCGSEDILPFESEEEYKDDYSFVIIILSALLLIIGYFFFVISTYIYFPIAIFIFIIISARIINRGEEQRKKAEAIERYYLCLECDNSFKL